MSTITHRETAKIYQFPVRSRVAGADHRGSADAAELMAQRISDSIGACWYHDAAIKQAALSKKP